MSTRAILPAPSRQPNNLQNALPQNAQALAHLVQPGGACGVQAAPQHMSKNLEAPASHDAIVTIGPKMSPIAALSMRTNTVSIGPVLPEDTGDLFLWLNDVKSASLDLPYRPVDWMSYNAWLAEITKGPTQVLFAIRRVVDPKIIGFLALTKIQAVHRSAEFGVRIGRKADRGRGYGTQATGLALRYAWDHLNLNRVYLSVFAFNRHAIRAYQTVGFQHEGTQKRAAFINGDWTDVILMGALRPERPKAG